MLRTTNLSGVPRGGFNEPLTPAFVELHRRDEQSDHDRPRHEVRERHTKVRRGHPEDEAGFEHSVNPMNGTNLPLFLHASLEHYLPLLILD